MTYFDLLIALGLLLGWAYRRLVYDGQHLVGLRLHLLAIQADGPFQLCLVPFELGLNIVYQWHPAIPMISRRTGHTLREFTLAIYNRRSTIRQ